MILLAGVEAANRWLLPPAHPVRDPPAESPVSGLPVSLWQLRTPLFSATSDCLLPVHLPRSSCGRNAACFSYTLIDRP